MTASSDQPPTAQPPTAQPPAAQPPAQPRTALARRVRVHHLREMKERGERFAMLTAYDMHAAAVFEEAGIPVLLVGDSAANNVLGYTTSLQVTVDELLPLVRAVTRSCTRPLVVADLPFGSYQESPSQAVATAVRFMKEGGAHGVKLEGGAGVAEHVRQLVGAGVPVMGHVGFTPQSEHAIGGYRVQGRGDDAADRVLSDAVAVAEAGAFAVVLEMVPAPVAARVTEVLDVPTIGIGAGPHCDGQVLIWQDMAGLGTHGRLTFVKQYADLRGALLQAARDYADDVRTGGFPDAEHSFGS